MQVPMTQTKSPSEKLESIAFQFCKIATVSLIAGRYTLPVAAILCAVLYVAAHFKGTRESRCVLRYPLLIAGVWSFVAIAWFAFALNPTLQDFAKHPFVR